MTAYVSVARALDRVPQGARVVATPGCAAPTTLLAGLGDLARDRTDVHLFSGLQLDDQPFVPAVEAGALRYTTWHVTPPVRSLVDQDVIGYLPTRLSDVPATLRRIGMDVALIRVSPPSGDGMVSLGPSMSYSRAAVEMAPIVIAEVDETLPRTTGPTLLHVERIAALVRSERPTPVYRGAPLDDLATAIARQVLRLLPDGPALQLGIGQVPEAIGTVLLADRVDRLRFIGLGTDHLVDLAEAGLLDQRPPGRAPPVAAVELMGGKRLMRFVDGNLDIGVYPSEQGHDPGWLASSFERIVSVNSAIQIDLHGQVNAEMVNGEQISAVGGSADFVDAARASRDGLSLVVMPSTARAGSVSRIVDRLPPGTVTTIPRHAYHAVVTEHGVADLRGLTTQQRAHALIAIADPDHREELQRGRWRRTVSPSCIPAGC